MNIRARNFFIAGSAGLALGGLLHMWGQFGGGEPPLASLAKPDPAVGARARSRGATAKPSEGAASWPILRTSESVRRCRGTR